MEVYNSRDAFGTSEMLNGLSSDDELPDNDAFATPAPPTLTPEERIGEIDKALEKWKLEKRRLCDSDESSSGFELMNIINLIEKLKDEKKVNTIVANPIHLSAFIHIVPNPTPHPSPNSPPSSTGTYRGKRTGLCWLWYNC